MSEKVSLSYAIEHLVDQGLKLSYKVSNGSPRPIYLTTPLVEIGDDEIAPVQNKLYSYFDPDGIVHITKRLWPLPDDVDIYLPEVPRFTEVRPGASFEEDLLCGVPIDVRYPYRL